MPEIDAEPVANFVVPVIRVERTGHEELVYKGFSGTAFILADSGGLALTARHVAEGLVVGETAVLFHRESGWQPVAVQGIVLHPTEDVAILRLEEGS